MGREVASVYRRRKFPIPSAIPPFPRSRSSSATTNSSMESLTDEHSNLTPARKHHKLLKDGSEVWSKDVEKIFVEGLRLYWQSPWATYSRGRSRWRNQFLVDHLKKAGIERTKKQVASHIQVLRNMWRGQPEFHLVAGGEELFQDNGLLAHTARRVHSAPSQFASSSKHDMPGSSGSSPSSTPEYPTSEFLPEFSTTATFPSLSPQSQMASFPDLIAEDMLASTVASSSMGDFGFGHLTSSPAHSVSTLPVKLEPLPMDPTLFTLPTASFADQSAADFNIHAPNRMTNLYFWADGMVPLSVDVDRLAGANPPMGTRLFLQFRVSMPPVADLRCPPNLQGVNGAVSFANSWLNLAKCQTKSFGPGRTVISQDLGLFTQVNTPEVQTVLNGDASSSPMAYAYLPDSALSRCHWLDNVDTITQQLVLDNEVLAVLVYHIDRVSDTARTVPAMELVSFQQSPRQTPSTPASAFQMLASSSPAISPHSSPLAHPFNNSLPSHSPHHFNNSLPSHSPHHFNNSLPSHSPLFTNSGLPAVHGMDDMASGILSYSYPAHQPAFGFHPH